MTVSCKREGGGVSAAGGAGRERGGRDRSPPDTHPPLSGGTGKRPNGASQPLLRGARAAKRNTVFRQCDRERAPPAPLRSSVRPRFTAAPGDRLPLTAVPGAGGTMARPGGGAAPQSLPLRLLLEGLCLPSPHRPGGAAPGPCGRPAGAAGWVLGRVKWGGPDPTGASVVWNLK
ncbi:translation initiation factor IF-2-like [Aquila chrysaetos chrysaetos]|uniref:translation initiation factor IF-2-like n=1 Tax=Aquila chrysaetos chrysaetos TaxID=223781 RepID=UPI001B7D3B24|nr:translation initiation factor IF-2-like [Aquila chrysaetos chrysaetos]